MENQEIAVHDSYVRGIEHQKQGDIDAAIADFGEVIRLDSSHVEAHIERAVAYISKGQFENAIVDCTQAIRLNSKGAAGYYTRALARGSNGDLKGAIKDYSEAIKLSTDYADAYAGRGGVREETGDYDGAMADFQEALRLNPHHADAFARRGFAYMRKGDMDVAAADFKEALSINPRHPQAEMMRMTAGDPGNARLRSEANGGAPAPVMTAQDYFEKGFGAIQQGDKETAIEAFRQALEIDPNHPDALIMRETLRNVSHPEVPNLDPSMVQPTVKMNRSRIRQVIAESNAAAPAAPTQQPAAPTPPPAAPVRASQEAPAVPRPAMLTPAQYVNRGADRFESGDPNGALADFTEAVRQDARFVDAYVNRGAVFHSMGDMPRALDDFKRALQLQPNHPDAAMMNEIINEASRPKAATTSARGKPGWTEFEVATDALGNNDPKRAITMLNSAIKANSKEQVFFSARGMAHQENGDLTSAIADFDKAIRLNPKLSSVYMDRGNARYMKEDFKAAISDFAEVTRLEPKNPNAYLNRGKAYFEKGDYKDAINDFTKVIALAGQNAEAFARRGLARLAVKDVDGATSDCEIALQIQPAQREATELLLSLQKAKAKKKR